MILNINLFSSVIVMLCDIENVYRNIIKNVTCHVQYKCFNNRIMLCWMSMVDNICPYYRCIADNFTEDNETFHFYDLQKQFIDFHQESRIYEQKHNNNNKKSIARSRSCAHAPQYLSTDLEKKSGLWFCKSCLSEIVNMWTYRVYTL